MADEETGYGDAEAARRRDEVIKRMLATPPQPRVKKVETGSVKPGNPDDGSSGKVTAARAPTKKNR